MSLNITNIEEIPEIKEKSLKKHWNINSFLKKMGTGIVLGALIISATGCSNYQSEEYTTIQQEQQQNQEYNEAWIKDQIDIAKEQKQVLQINEDGTLSMLDIKEGQIAGQIVFEKPETEIKFKKFHEELEKYSKEIKKSEENNETIQTTSQIVNSGGHSNGFMWYMIGRYMSNNQNSIYKNYAFGHYHNKGFSTRYENHYSHSKFSLSKLKGSLKEINKNNYMSGKSRVSKINAKHSSAHSCHS